MRRVLLTLVFVASPAFAVPVVYTTPASFQVAVGGPAYVITEDFESLPVGPLAAGTTDIGLFSITIDNNNENGVRILEPGYVNGSREFGGDIDNDANMILNFSDFSPSSLIGFAGTWGTTTSGDLLTATVNSVTFKFSDYLSGSGDGFLGFYDSAGITAINFGRENPSSKGEFFGLDNALLGIPESSTAILLACGLAGLAAAGRRRAAY